MYEPLWINTEEAKKRGIKTGDIVKVYNERGAINLISPSGPTSQHCGGQATTGYLVELEKVKLEQMEEWKIKYPEAFKREYEPNSGLRFNGWVEE